MSSNVLDNLANSTAIILDRTTTPPTQVGQGFMVSKSRIATCASSVFQYLEAPWALQLVFPYPDLTLGVKAVTLNFDFDRRAARDRYLAQTGDPFSDQIKLPNDIAMLVMDSNLQDLNADKVAEFNRAMYTTYPIESGDITGATNDIEFLEVIKSLLNNRQSGLFTLLNNRKIPVAQIELSNYGISNVLYRQLKGELAFFELVCNNNAETYVFSPNKTFNFAPNCAIQAPTPQMAIESLRRHSEMPKLLENLGGPDIIFQKVVDTINPSDVSEAIAWFSPNLWECIDGFIKLDKIALKLNLDLFTVAVGIREFVSKGFISPIMMSSPFPCSGEIGNPIMAHTDLEIHPLDQLQAFYLDPYSYKATVREGAFFGSASALQPKNLLHTISMPTYVYGAQILKGFKLVGLHSGPYNPKADQPNLPKSIYQFMWIGSLTDMSTKKLRSTSNESEEIDDDFGKPSTKLRSIGLVDNSVQSTVIKPPSIRCANCFTKNVVEGHCVNCNYEVKVGEFEQLSLQPKDKIICLIQDFKQKFNLNNTHMYILAGVLGTVFCFVLGSIFIKPQQQQQVAVVNTKPLEEKHESSSKAALLASQAAGFSETPLPDFWYEDTSTISNPLPSFGLYSKVKNQKLLFIIMSTDSPYQQFDKFLKNPVYIKTKDLEPDGKVADGSVIIGNSNMKWFVGRYGLPVKPEKYQNILMAAYQSPINGRTVFIIGSAYEEAVGYNYQDSIRYIDTMAREYTKNVQNGNSTVSDSVSNDDKASTEDNSTQAQSQASDESKSATNATDENTDGSEVANQDNAETPKLSPKEEFCKQFSEKLQSSIDVPEDVTEELKKIKYTKNNTMVEVELTVDKSGQILKFDITQTALYEKLTDLVKKAINDCIPIKGIPAELTSSGNLTLDIKYYKGHFDVSAN